MRLPPSSLVVSLLVAALLVPAAPTPAVACGCLVPPNPAQPVYQARERIAFAAANGQVTAHVQLAYSGNADEFGWLLPLPSIPTLELGADELFEKLLATTDPRFELQIIRPQCGGGGAGDLGFAAAPDLGSFNGDLPAGPPWRDPVVVIQDSIGPYEYAVLHADDQRPMLNWLAVNRYFVPPGTGAMTLMAVARRRR